MPGESTVSPIAILGAGMMGAAIAAAHLRCAVPVVLFDSDVTSLDSAPNRVAEELRLQNFSFDESLLHVSSDIVDIVSSPILIETITEKTKAKQKLYRNIEKKAENQKPFLFSNTSTISITKLAEGLSPDWRRRFCGFHVFHPVRKNSLLEIIPGKETDTETVETARKHALRIDKQPITVGDGPGFLVNRILNPYLSSALQMLEEGVDMQRIDRVATDFGMRMGPFRIMDEIGLDVVLHAGWVLYKAFPDRVPNSPILVALIESGRLGRKTGQGFMLYSNSISWDGEGIPDSDLQFEIQNKNNLLMISDKEIEQRLFCPMYDEAVRCRDDGIISDLADADIASVYALGFPAAKKGIVRWHAAK